MIVRHINNNTLWNLLSFLPKAVFLTTIMVIFLVSWFNEGGLLRLDMPCLSQAGFTFWHTYRTPKLKNFRHKRSSLQKLLRLMQRNLFHFHCSLVMEEESFSHIKPPVTLNQNWVNLTLVKTSLFQKLVEVLSYFSRSGMCRNYLRIREYFGLEGTSKVI